MKLLNEKQGMLGRPYGWRGAAPALGIAKLAEGAALEEVEPPATKGSDTVALLLVRTREFGDALKDAQAAEYKRVYRANAGYRLPYPATSRDQAIVAFMLLMRSAKDEMPKNKAFWDRSEQEAAYNFRNSSIAHILRSAVSYTSPTPRTQAVAKQVLAASTAPSAAIPAAIKKTVQRVVDVFTPPSASPSAPAEDTASWTDSIPSWAPWAAGGVLLLAGGALILRRGSK